MDICKHSLCRISFSITPQSPQSYHRQGRSPILPNRTGNDGTATEEVKYQQEQDCGDESRGIEHPTSTDSMIQRNVHDKEYREKR